MVRDFIIWLFFIIRLMFLSSEILLRGLFLMFMIFVFLFLDRLFSIFCCFNKVVVLMVEVWMVCMGVILNFIMWVNCLLLLLWG